MRNLPPCYQCRKRELGCHSVCGDYAAFQERNAERRAKQAVERAIISGHADMAKRIRDRSAVKYRED